MARAAPPPAVSSTLSEGGAESGLGALYRRYAIPVAILVFALGAQAVVLPLIFFVLWLQRKKLFPNGAAPWSGPARLQPWIERMRARAAADPKGPNALLLKWTANPPYNDAAAFETWMTARIAAVVIAVFGALLVLRGLVMVLDRLAPAHTTMI